MSHQKRGHSKRKKHLKAKQPKPTTPTLHFACCGYGYGYDRSTIVREILKNAAQEEERLTNEFETFKLKCIHTFCGGCVSWSNPTTQCDKEHCPFCSGGAKYEPYRNY